MPRGTVHNVIPRVLPLFPQVAPLVLRRADGRGWSTMTQALEDVHDSRVHRLQSAGGRVPPHNLDAEESLLGAMLLSRDATASAVEFCTSEDFYKPAHSHIFGAITALYTRGEPADPVTVADELRRSGLLEAVGDASVLISLQVNTASTANALHYP